MINKLISAFMTKHKEHILNFVSFIFTRLIAIIAYAISVPFFIRHNSDASYGIVAIGFSLLSCSALFDLAIGYVLTLSLGRGLARSGNKNQQLVSGMISVYIYLAIATTVLILLILAILDITLSERIFYGGLAVLLPFLAVSGVSAAVFQAYNDLTYINISRFSFEICKASALAISVLTMANYKFIGLILLVGAAARAVSDVLVLRKRTGYILKLISLKLARNYVRLILVGSYSFGVALVSLLILIGDKLLIKTLISSEAVAYYSFAFDINSKAYLLMGAINTAVYTLILRNHAQGRPSHIHIRIGMLGILILAIIYYIPLMFFSFNIISWLVASTFAMNTAKLTSLMSCASLIYLIGGVYGNALSAMGGTRYSFYAHTIAIGFYFILLFFLVKPFGVSAFMYAYLGLCIVLAIGLIYSYHILSKKRALDLAIAEEIYLKKLAEERKNLAIVVASCDKYSDLWETLFSLLFKYWPDCPYPVYLIANKKKFEHERVTTLLAGEDLSWSTTIIKALQDFPHSHLLFLLDDVFPIAKIETAEVERIYKWVIDHNTCFIRLRPKPKPKIWLSEGIGVLDKSAAYRVSLFATLWSTKTLNMILKDGESAWEFELLGTERSRQLDKFYCTKRSFIKYLHGVERGIWIRSTARKLENMGYKLDYSKRRLMSRVDSIWYTYRLFKSWVFSIIPENKRITILKYIQKFYKLVGLR
ncbi:MAG: hypothetical protein K0R14_607 [Burkholderiales bacterium]|jgi:O-antigen/teichoic acid export membrane protein|nr:hypothetical protein [Burkholderiales bacterium]